MLKPKSKIDSPVPSWTMPAAVVSSHIYTSVINTRNFFYDKFPSLSTTLDRPTISIGGIRAGGVGKTPVAQMIGEYITRERGRSVAFLSRGYGRVCKRHVVVKPHEDACWEDVGDEPCMIHRNVPESWLGIGADRAALARTLTPMMPERSVFIMDDGFQRRQVKRDLDIVCISENILDDKSLPAGYLREPASSLARAGLVLIIGQEDHINTLRVVKSRLEDRFADIEAAVVLQYPHSWVNAVTGESCSAINTPARLKNAAIVSGIARPERFITMARRLGIEPSDIRTFADHHNFKKNDFLFDRNVYYNEEEISVITTEKDFVRLRKERIANFRALWYVKIGLRFADADSESLVFSKINNITL